MVTKHNVLKILYNIETPWPKKKTIIPVLEWTKKNPEIAETKLHYIFPRELNSLIYYLCRSGFLADLKLYSENCFSSTSQVMCPLRSVLSIAFQQPDQPILPRNGLCAKNSANKIAELSAHYGGMLALFSFTKFIETDNSVLQFANLPHGNFRTLFSGISY